MKRICAGLREDLIDQEARNSFCCVRVVIYILQ